jgi:small subunit ribosomal protein S7
MSRRTRAPKRNILPDPRFGSELLAKFMNMIMSDGKRTLRW